MLRRNWLKNRIKRMFWLNVLVALFLFALLITFTYNQISQNKIQEQWKNQNFNQIRGQIQRLEKGVMFLDERTRIQESPVIIEVNPEIIIPRENKKSKTDWQKFWDAINGATKNPFEFNNQPSMGI